MIITKVTMTGADDTIRHSELFKTSEIFPFVEWGILVGAEYYGRSRFPSKSWLETLAKKAEIDSKAKFSCHLCGRFVNNILMGGDVFQHLPMEDWAALFSRVQINTHGVMHQFAPIALENLMRQHENLQFIFQYDEANPLLMQYILPKGGSALFDASHGAGVLPAKWPQAIPGVKCGYAGGLGPENIAAELEKINQVVPEDTEIWIDMETKLFTTEIRSGNPVTKFDIKKVTEVLQIVEKSGYLKNSFQQT